MEILSQRDDRWKNNTIGTSTSTFGDFGCLITSIAMLAGKNPIEVNNYLNSVGGYVDGDLVIWSRLDGLLNNEQKFPCIAQVDENYMHFVVALDNENIIDPYYGDQIKVTDRYRGIKQLYPWTMKGDFMTEEEARKFCERQREPFWRNTHPNQKMDEGYFKKECEDIVNRFKNGEEWAGADLTDKWFKEMPVNYVDTEKVKEEIKEELLNKISELLK